MHKLSYKTLFIILFFLLIAIVVLLRFFIIKPNPAAAGWWNESWHYRKEINIGYEGPTTATNTRIKILSNYDLSTFINNNKIQSDLDDLRFTDINGNLINYWIEDSTNNSVDIWGNVPTLYNPNTAIYMYYGNPSAASKSDGSSIFGTSVNPAGLNCSDIRNHHNSPGGSGVYWIDADGSGVNSPFQNYCDMTTDDGGWTLVMKLNGSLNTFEYDSNYWTNTTTYHPESSDFDNNEAKLQSYSTVDFDQINLYMKDIGGTNLNKVTLTQTSSSLYSLISGGAYTATSIGRTSWLSLLENIASQPNCNQEGFNVVVPMTRSRIGMAMNGENDCNSCDNLIGFGNNKTGHPWGPYVTVGGGVAAVNPVKAAYGWIFVRATLQSTDLSSLLINLSSIEEVSTAPIAYWKFDEGVGTTAYDSTSNNNNGIFGTGNSAPTWVSEEQCVSGKCLSFNGSTNYINFGNQASINLHDQPLTISTWVKPNDTSTGRLFDKTLDSSDWDGYDLIYNGGTITFNLLKTISTVTGSITSTSTLPQTKWSHIEAIYDNTTMYLYINGKLDKSIGYTGGYDSITGHNAVMGKHFNAAIHFFNGYLDETKIYPYARTADQIKLDYNSRGSSSGSSVNLGIKSSTAPSLSSKLIAYWKLDEGSGTITYDSSENNNTAIFGTGTSAPTWSNDGKFNKALNFDGNDKLSSTGSSTNNPTIFTISTWVKLNQFNPNTGNIGSVIFANYGTALKGIIFYIYDDGRIGARTHDGTTGYDLKSIHSINLNQWNYITTSYDGTNLKIFLNGKQENTRTASSAMNNNTAYIGGWGDNGLTNGLLDEVKIYNTALTAEEIKQDYNQGAAVQFGVTNQTIGGTTTSLEYCIPGDTSHCASPIAEWKMDEGVGTSVYDTSGNNYNGVFSNNPTWIQGKIGRALNITSGNYVALNTLPTLNNPYTLSYWFYPTSTSGFQQFISLAGSNGYPVFGLNGTRLLAYAGPEKYKYGSRDFNANDLNKWWFVTFIVNNPNDLNTWKVYLNGIDETGSSGANTGTYYSPSTPGQITGGTSGKIDQIRIYNYVRTPAQIAYDYNKGGPVGWWKFDECQGNIAYDWSGIGNTGTIIIGASGTQNSLGTCQVGTSAAWTNGTTGKINSSLSFDGNDDYVNSGTAIPLLIGSKNFSYSGWIKYSSLSSTYSIPLWIGANTTNNGFLIGFRKGNSRILYSSWANLDGEIAGITSEDNKWYHVVGAYNGNTHSFYINGKLQNSTAFSTSNFISGNIYFGLIPGGGYPFNGQIDDVRIYNYALTSEQVKQVYNGGAVNFR